MKLLLVILAIILSSCAPVKVEDDYQTKYPDAPTMQSAEDAMKGEITY